MKISGLDQLSKTLDQIAKRAESLNGKHSVPMTDLFTDEFMSGNTRFQNLEEFFLTGGFNTSSQKAFEEIPEETLNGYVAVETLFGTWQEFMAAAGEQWAKNKLGI